jgi:mannose-6-phosphate isomerase-like protein (cupin superfamily)
MQTQLLSRPKQTAPKIVLPGQGRATSVFGVRVTILVGSEDTDNAYCSYEAIVEPGQGPPPHVHENEDEAFYVQEGEFEILAGDSLSRVGPGSYVFLPRHLPHTFKNVGAVTGRLLGTATPGGHEHFFVDADALERSGTFSPITAAAVCRQHGIEILMPPE